MLKEIKTIELIDPGDADAEWSKIIEAVLMDSPELKNTLIYLFGKFQGYIATRIKAGLILANFDPEAIEVILDDLTSSKSPDDNDTALGFIEQYNISRYANYLKRLINNPFEYISKEADRLLKEEKLRNPI